MSISNLPARAEALPLIAEEPPIEDPASRLEATATPDDLQAGVDIEPMPPVPSDELTAALEAEREPIRFHGKVAGVWNRLLHKRGFDPERRAFLSNSAGAIAVGVCMTQLGQAALLNHTLHHFDAEMSSLWSDNAPSFNFIGEVPRNPHELAIFLPGFGDMNSDDEAAIVKKQGQVDPEIPLGYLDYSNNGATIEQMVHSIRNKVPNLDKVKSLTLVCRSLGGPFGIALATELGIPVRNMVFCSSPYLISDGDFGEFGALLAKLPDSMLGSTATKDFVNYWDDATRNPQTSPFPEFQAAATSLVGSFSGTGSWKSVLHHVMQGLDNASLTGAIAWRQTLDGANPIADQNELKTWDSETLPTDPSQIDTAQLKKFHKVFVPGYTQVLYTATRHPSTDSTVKVVSSAYHYKQFFLNVIGLGSEDVRVEGLPYDGHANVSATMQSIYPWLRRNTREQFTASDLSGQ